MKHLIAFLVALTSIALPLGAQLANFNLFPRQQPEFDIFRPTVKLDTLDIADDEIIFDEWGMPVQPGDLLGAVDTVIMVEEPPYIPGDPIAKWYFAPLVYDDYIYADTLSRVNRSEWLKEREIYGWLYNEEFNRSLMRQLKRTYLFETVGVAPYNVNSLPEPPKHYHAFVDPETTQIIITEKAPAVTASQAADMKLDIERRNWLSVFNAGLQFSQAYISPNWYQGGNNNLNIIANVYYNIKLNEAFYKNIMFETTVQYKLGLNSAPDDSLRSYSISEDLFQINSKFGLRAAKRWFYSVNLAFKTQLLNSYTSNTRNLKASLLSPGELNIGLGMTYNYTNPKNTFTFNASLSPLSYNMKTCISSRMNEENFGIAHGHKTVSEFGSSGECQMTWKIAYNIQYRSRLFAFTDYDYFQGDWEHTISFDINRFLTTQLFVHMRYDSSTPRSTETNSWRKFQLKEILSLGFSYKFSTK